MGMLLLLVVVDDMMATKQRKYWDVSGDNKISAAADQTSGK